MKDPRRLLEVTVFVILLVVAAVLHFWLKVFSDQPLSTDPAEWAAFADYFGGMINPIIAIANLVFLIYISFQLAHREDQRSLNALRHEALQKVVSALSDVPNPIFGLTDEDLSKYRKALNDFSDFNLGYGHLFNHAMFELTSMQVLLTKLWQNASRYIRLKAKFVEDPERAAIVLEEVEEFYNKKFQKESAELMRRLTETF